MPSNFELIGVEAIIAGVAAFERDANTVNKLLNQINNTTQGLASGNAFNILGSAAGTAFSAIVAGSAAAVTALAGVSVGAVEVAASFEQSVLRTAAVTGASADNIRALGDSVIQVGNDSRLGLSEIADAENSLARAGFSATDITNGLLEATTKFAEASGGKLGAAQAADLMSEAIKAYGLSGGEATKVADALTGAVNSSVIRYGDLSIILRQVVPIAAAMNIPISDLATSIGLLGQAGISGSVAGSALKDVLVKLADPSKIAAQEMKKYGITIQDTKGNILPFREVIDTLNKSLGDQAVATGKVTAEQRLQILANAFGTRGVEAALALVRGGAPAFDQMAKAIANTDVNKLADDMRNSLFPQLDRLKNIIQGFVVDTGLPLEQALTTSIKKVNDLLAALDPRIPKLFGQALLTAFSGVGASTVEFNADKLLGPSFGGVFNGVLDIILSVRSAIVDDIVPAFRVLFDTITGGRSPMGDFTNLLGVISRTISVVGKDIATGIEYVAAFITEMRNLAVVPGIVKDVSDAIKLLIATINQIITVVQNLDTTLPRIANAAKAAFDNFKASIEPLLPLLRDGLIAALLLLAPIIENILIKSIVNLRVELGILIKDISTIISDVILYALRLYDLGAAFVQLTINIGRAVVAVMQFIAATVAEAIPAIVRFIVFVGNLSISFVTLGVNAVAAGARIVAAFVTQAAGVVASGAAIAASAVRQAASFVATGAAAISGFGQAGAAATGAASVIEIAGGAIDGSLASVDATLTTTGDTAIAAYGQVATASQVSTDIVIANNARLITSNTSLDESFGSVGAGYTVSSVPLLATSTAVTDTVIGNNLRIIESDAGLAAADALKTAAFVADAAVIAAAAAVETDAVVTADATIIGSILAAVGAALVAIAPFVVGVLVIGTVIAVVAVAWVNNWNNIRETTGNAVASVGASINNLVSTIISSIGQIINALGPVFTTIAPIIGTALLIALGLVIVFVRTVLNEIGNLASGLGQVFGFIGTTLVPVLTTVLSAIIPVVEFVVKAFIGFWTGAATGFAEIIAFIIKALVAFFDALHQLPIVGAELDKLGGNFSGLRDTGQKAIDDLNNEVSKFQINTSGATDGVGKSIADLLATTQTDFAGMVSSIQAYVDSMVGGARSVIAATDDIAAANARLAASYRFLPDQTQTQTSIAQNYERQSGQAGALPAQTTPSIPAFVPQGPTPTPLAADKTKKASDTIKSITLELERMFKVLPGNTKALAEFINQLNQVTPGRGLKLADDLIAARDQIVAIQKEYGKVLAIQQAQVVVQDDINKLTAQQNVLELQTQQATIGYQIQINQLDQQSLAIKQQMLPIENAIADIDRQIAAIQATNYAGEALSLENQLAQARIQQQMLPTQQKIADIEKQITNSVNQRTLLLQQQQELQQGKAADTTQYALDQVQAKLKAAFNSKDYTQVVALEQQQYALEQTLIAQKDQLKLTQDHNKLTQDDNAITQNALKLQEQGYIDILKPLGDQLYLLQQQGATIDANQKIIQLENSIAINALNQQKAALEATLDPLKQQLTAIQQQHDAIQLNIDIIKAQQDAQKLQLDAKLLNDKLELESLKDLEKNEQERFNNIVLGFVNAQVASGNFTEGEAANVIKVLGFWDGELQKLQDLIDKFGSEKAAAQAVVDTIALIKDKTVTITIKYVTEGSPSSFAEGGVVGGPAGSPQLIIAHGGEQFLGVGVTTPVSTQRPGIGNSAQQVVNNYYNYEVNASYKQQQSPSNVGMDLRALIAMTSR